MFDMWLMGLVAAEAATVPRGRPAPTEVPAGSLSRDVLAYFEGRWAGEGSFVRSGKPVQSTYRFESVLDGRALLASHEELPPNSFAFVALWSVDKRSGDLVLMMAGNQAGGARLFRSSGWEGDKLVFRPDTGLMSDFGQERMAFERLSANQFSVRYEMSRDGMEWSGGDFQTFVKQPD